MLKPAIQQPLTKIEVKELVNFLSYHLGYVPVKTPKAHFCKTAKEFTELYEGYKVREPDKIDEINRDCNAFFDHPSDTIVFQGFSYHEGAEIPQFIVPMSTVIHELIHFYQYATGTFGSYRVFYEGTNDILSCFLVNDFSIDYKEEAIFAFSIIMEIVGHDFFAALQWIRTYTLHSNKNKFVHREIKRCPSFSKYSPQKLLRLLDDETLTVSEKLAKIENEETRKILTRYPLRRIISLCKKHRNTIQL